MRYGTKKVLSLLTALAVACSLLVTPAAADTPITVTVTSSGSLKHIFANNPANTNAESLKNHVANSYTFTGTYTLNDSTVTVPITATWSDPEFENGNSKSFSPQGFQGWLHGSAQYYYPATFSTSAVPPSGYTFQFTSGWRSSNFLVAAVMATQTFDTRYKTVDRAVIQGDTFQLSDLGLPETVNVTYAAYREGGFNPDVAVGKLEQEDGQYRITDWKMGDEDLTVKTLRAAAGDSGYQDLKLTPVYADSGDNAVPVWATLEEKPQFTLTVGPGEPTEITVTPPDDIIYGSALGEPKATATVGGVPLTVATFTYRYTGRYHANQYSDGTLYDSETPPTQAGEYQVIATLIHDTYSGKGTSATSFTISPKPVTITGITIEDKEYNGGKAADVGSAVIDGKEDGDTLEVSVDANFDDKNVGEHKYVRIQYGTYSLTGKDAPNYKIDVLNSQGWTYAKITPKKVSVIDTNFSVTKEYDGTTAPGTKSGSLDMTGRTGNDNIFINNDKVTVGPYDTPDVGREKTVILSNIELFGRDVKNYTIDPTYEFKRAEITSGRSKPELGTDFTVDIPSSTYNGQPHPAAVMPISEGLGAYTVTYGKWHGTWAEYPSKNPPVNAGEYVVYVSFTEGTNFAYADNLEAGRLVIGKASGTATASVTLGAGETRTFYLGSLFSYSEYGGNIKIKEGFDKRGTTAFNQVTGNDGYGYIEVSAKLVNADKSEDFTLNLTTENYDPLTVTMTVEVKKCDLTFTLPEVTVEDPGTFPKGTKLSKILTLSGGSAWLNRTEIKGKYELQEPDEECEPGTYTNHPFNVVFTSTDGQHTGETQVLASFTITDYTAEFSPFYIPIYANSAHNESAETLLKLVGERKGSYKDGDTYAATWSADSGNLAFAPKGYADNLWYSYTAAVKDRPERPKAYVRVVPVNATPFMLAPGSSIKTMKAEEVTALTEENWKSALGLPAMIVFKNEPAEEVKFIDKKDKFPDSDKQKGYPITGWKLDGKDLTLADLKAKADSAIDLDVTVELTPVYTHDTWATVTGSIPTFKLTITPKTPVSVTWNTPQSFDYGTTLGELLELWKSDPTKGCDEPVQNAIGNGGMDSKGTWQYFYYSSDGTRLSGEPKDAGTYKAQAVLVSDTHSGASELKEFTINPKHVKFLTFEEPEGIENLTYNKQPQTPEYIVKDGETVLVKDRDYTVEYTNNVNAGTATVTFTGKGNYTGTKDETFTILQAHLEGKNPTISGSAKAGEVLSASLDDVDAAELEWTWTVGGTPVKGNTTASYKVQPKDSNKEITVTAKARDQGNYSGTSGASDGKTVAMVKVTGTVTFSTLGGPIKVGTKLTPMLTAVTPEDARTGGTLLWRVNGKDKEGERDDSYIVKDGDREIIAVFTPNENYTGSIESARIEVGKILLGGSVDISGGNTVGELLTADTSDMPDTSLAFIWLRNNEPIPGANQRTYTVTKADRGKTLKVRVTAEGYTGERVSYDKGIPAVAPDKPTVTVTAGDKKLTISWSAPADDGGAPIIGYKLTVKDDKNKEVLSATLAANVTSYTLENLTNGTEYSISVQAVNSDNKTSEAGTAVGTPKAPGGGNQPGGGGSGGGGSSGGGGGGGNGNGNGATNPDGSKVKVETKGDGTVITTVQNKDGSSGVTVVAPSGQTTATVRLPSSVAGRAANGGSAVLLPVQGIYASQSIDRAPAVTINTSGVNGVRVDIPLANRNAGVVAVRVMADGTEQIIKRTIPTRNGVALLVNSGDTVKLLDNGMSFADTRGHWAADAVSFVSARGLFYGTGADVFSPDAAMTRGMLVTVLARYADVDTVGGATWYEKGAAWAVANGLSDGTNLDSNITREQLIAIMYRYAAFEGKLDDTGVDLHDYTDANRISSWAADAMSWAVGVGLIKGVTPTTLEPQGSATRAQVAAIIMRYAELFGL